MPINPSSPVVVGVDGSEAALVAVRWAVDEALVRRVRLRIVHATSVTPSESDSPGRFDIEQEYAEQSLRTASAAAMENGKAVDVETAILWGEPDAELVDESSSAAMVCVGSTGIGRIARQVLGSTAATIAAKARCTAAVIRPTDRLPPGVAGSLAVAVDDAPDNARVLSAALDEARLRNFHVFALSALGYDVLDQRVAELGETYPGVHVIPVAATGGIARFVAQNRDLGIQTAVIGEPDTELVTDIVGPHGRSTMPHGQCSVLVVR